MENDGAKKRRTARTRVERQFDNIKDMSSAEREELFNKMLDDQIDETAAAKQEGDIVNPMDYAEEAMKRRENFGKMVGLSSGYYDIDKMTLGFCGGELTIVAGETSQGKTLLCCNIAANMVKAGYKVAFVTLEMTKAELLSRFWSIWQLGTTPDDIGRLNELVYNGLRFQKCERMNWKAIPYLIEQSKKWGAEIVFIDHLHYFARDMRDMANELGMVTQEFKRVAIHYNLPIVLVSHTRKVDKTRRNASATIDDLRGSSYIGQDADIVLMVRQNPEEMTDAVCVRLEKNRNRLDYKIGSEVWHQKNGLVLDDVVDRRAVDQNSVNYKRSITTAMPMADVPPIEPKVSVPQANDPAPWAESSTTSTTSTTATRTGLL